MSRYRYEININGVNQEKIDDVKKRIKEYLYGKGFILEKYRGEMVFRKGYGFLFLPLFIHILHNKEKIIVEAWLKWCLMPFVYVFEMNHKKFRYIDYFSKQDLDMYVWHVESIIERYIK